MALILIFSGYPPCAGVLGSFACGGSLCPLESQSGLIGLALKRLSGTGRVYRKGEGGEYAFVAGLSHVTYDHASLREGAEGRGSRDRRVMPA